MRQQISDRFLETDAPIIIVMGQSNAHGHATRLTEEEKKIYPLQNVYGLSREKNQSYDIADVTWDHFRTEGMNLGESQDHTCCLAGEFARMWQERIDAGNPLPNLYVIQISIGSQGIDEEELDGLNLWYPGREKILKPGSLDVVDISLYPLATHVFHLAVQNLIQAGKTPRVIGMHWNQWETEVFTGGEVLKRAGSNYRKFFKGFYDALGMVCDTYMYQPLSEVYCNEEGRRDMTLLIEHLASEQEQIHVVDISQSDMWDASRDDRGIFQDDLVHYSCDAQRWFAKHQFDLLEELEDANQTCKAETKEWQEDWEGHEAIHFLWQNLEVTIALPEHAAPGNPWVYRTEFFGAFPSVDLAMLEKGYAIANLQICDQYGAPRCIGHMERFREMLVAKYHLAQKPILFGFSRGGLYALHYAAAYPMHVDQIYFDAPVVDITSWPGKYDGGNSKEWVECREVWYLSIGEPDFMKTIQEALQRIMQASIPVALVYGDVDEIVPYEENGILIEQAYRESNIPFLCIRKPGIGHHPHSLENPTPVVDFLIKG